MGNIFAYAAQRTVFTAILFLYKSPSQHSFGQLKEDGYQFEIVEGKSDKTQRTSLSKITPNEIILNGSFEYVISKLTRHDVKEIKFKNSLLAKKKISLTFKNDSAYISEKTDSACLYALHSLLNNYKLNIKSDKRWTSSCNLSIHNDKLFQSNASSTASEEEVRSIRTFYGAKDTIKLNNINSKYLSSLIEINFKTHVNNQIDDSRQFSINVPNTTPSKLNKYFKENYGLELKQKRAKVNFLIVEKR